MSKKGVSDIIATVLIILLVLAAIVIVWQAIRPLISTPLPSNVDCLTLSLSIQKLIESTGNCDSCTDTTKNGAGKKKSECTGTLCAWTETTPTTGSVLVKREAGAGSLKKIKVLSNGKSAQDYATTIGELETVDIPQSINDKDTISVAPIVGDSNVLCPTSDTEEAPYPKA